MHKVNVDNLSVQNCLFPLHDELHFKAMESLKHRICKQYCRSKMAVDIARILKVSTSPASIKYKFSIQVPKGIKYAIDLDKKNGTSYGKKPLRQSLT
jgi:hypothetical protein